MFKIKLNNSQILKSLIETLAGIIDETELIIDPEQFTVVAIDPSRICLLKFVMNKSAFDEYECDKESKVPVNLMDLDKIMKRSSAKDSIELDFDEKAQKIKIRMRREGTSRARTFSLMLLDLDTEEIPIDNLLKMEYKSKWNIDVNFLIEAIKDAEIYSEIFEIECSEKGLKFSSFGQIGEMEYDLNKDELNSYENEGENKGAYSITFLKSILKLSTITEALNVSLKTDHPTKMIFDITEGGKLSYFLAPRVEFEDDDFY